MTQVRRRDPLQRQVQGANVVCSAPDQCLGPDNPFPGQPGQVRAIGTIGFEVEHAKPSRRRCGAACSSSNAPLDFSTDLISHQRSDAS
jgi:hypothetical protein